MRPSIIEAILALAESGYPGQRGKKIGTPVVPKNWEMYPIGREVMLETEFFAYPVVVKSTSFNLLTVEGALLGKLAPGQEIFLNRETFFVHRVSKNSVTLTPTAA